MRLRAQPAAHSLNQHPVLQNGSCPGLARAPARRMRHQALKTFYSSSSTSGTVPTHYLKIIASHTGIEQVHCACFVCRGHPDTEAAVAAALSAVQRLKRAAPSTSTGSQPGGATKRAATHVASHADDACDLAQKLARSKVQGSPEDSHSAHSGSSGPGDASGTQHPQGDDPSVATSRLPGVGQDESSTHVPLNQGTHSDTKDTSAPQSPDIHVPLLGQLSLQAGIGPAPVAPQGPAHRTTGSDHHAGDSGVVEAGTDVSGSQGRESKPKKARSQVAAAAPQAQVATSTGMGSGKGGQAQASQQVQTESAQAQGAPSASPPRTQSHSQVSLSTSVPSWPAPDTPTDAAVSAAAPPDMASYLDGFPLAKEMIYTVRGTPNNSTKTPLALVNEYAARLTLEVRAVHGRRLTHTHTHGHSTARRFPCM